MKTPNIKMRKLAFRISSTKDWQYSHVTIDILAPKYNWSEAGELESLLSLRWQSDKDNGFDKWYGLSVSFESRDSSPENIAAQIALASRTFAKVLPASSDSLPATVILQLAAMKVDRVAHDSRLSRYVSQAEMPSIALTRCNRVHQGGNAPLL